MCVQDDIQNGATCKKGNKTQTSIFYINVIQKLKPVETMCYRC